MVSSVHCQNNLSLFDFCAANVPITHLLLMTTGRLFKMPNYMVQSIVSHIIMVQQSILNMKNNYSFKMIIGRPVSAQEQFVMLLPQGSTVPLLSDTFLLFLVYQRIAPDFCSNCHSLGSDMQSFYFCQMLEHGASI